MNNYLQTIQQFLLLSPYALLIINQIPLFQTIDSPLTYTLAAASIFTRLIFFLLHAFTFNLPPKILINS